MGKGSIGGVPTNTSGSDGDKPDAGRFVIHGAQGSGKTTLASTIARCGKTLYLDMIGERGTRSFEGADYAKNIDIARPQSIVAMDDIFWALDSGDHDYKAVVIDSMTAVQKMTMRYLLGHSETAVKEIRRGTAPAQIQTWGQALDIMTDLSTFFNGLADGQRDNPMHVIMTAQTKVTQDEMTEEITRHPDVQKGALSIFLAATDYVLYTDLEQDIDSEEEDDVYRHIVRFGANPEYRTKGRIPPRLQGKMPSVLGRKKPADLSTLVRVLGMGGAVPPAQKKRTTEKNN